MRNRGVSCCLVALAWSVSGLSGEEGMPVIERDPAGASWNALRMLWPAGPGKFDFIEQSADLEKWRPVRERPERVGVSFRQFRFTATATGTGTGESGFYRIVRHAGPPFPASFVRIPPGSFVMGSPPDEPGRYGDELPHTVTISEPFYMGATEVTNEQMRETMQWAYDTGRITATPGTVRNLEGSGQELLDLDIAWSQLSFSGGSFIVDPGKEGYPCLEVTWFGAMAYANFLGDREGRERAVDFSDWTVDWGTAGYRLPTEAEWEYAARAGTTTAFHTGAIVHPDYEPVDPNLNRAGWYWGNSTNPDNPMASGKGTHVAGSKQPNAWELHDMHGNVWEWCWDWYGSYESGDPARDPRGPESGSNRVLRGGSWNRNARACRSAVRSGITPASSSSSIGFRLARGVGQ